jgi:hypothetical protein
MKLLIADMHEVVNEATYCIDVRVLKFLFSNRDKAYLFPLQRKSLQRRYNKTKRGTNK